MKKRTRDIVVHHTRFTYSIREVGTWPGVLTVRVWSTRYRNGQKLNVSIDPFVSIKPSGVRGMIEWALDAGWKPEEHYPPLILQWVDDCPISDLASTSPPHKIITSSAN